jgi:ParB family transcriptional regulator, chromosome partitioning protein
MTHKRDSQPYQIKGVEALLGINDSEDAAPSLVPTDRIVLPQQQPRRYFDPRAMQELVESVKQLGILQPLLVRPIGGSKYELVAGERRYRAASSLGLTEVPVAIRELTDAEALQIALLENLQREDLNAIEETEGILQLLAMKLNSAPESVVALLGAAAHPERDGVDNVIHSSDWQTVSDTFALVGKYTPESFRTNRLPLLNLPDDVIGALREGRIEYTKARAIARIKDSSDRSQLLEEAIALDLSLTQIKQRVVGLKAKTGEATAPDRSLKSRVDAALQRVKKSKD